MDNELFSPEAFDLSKTKTFDVWERKNLVTIDTQLVPGKASSDFYSDELELLADKIVEARKSNKPVVLFYGAHVIKRNLSLFLIDWVKKGIITHLSSNGAGSIHDFELAFLGGTSEHVPTAIEDGSFGMWEQTGSWMNKAINLGACANLGYGEALALYVENNPDKFPHKEHCVFYNAYKNNIAATYHISIGTDIIHQHPLADFASLGKTSGRDFAVFTGSVSKLEEGVFINLGSAVTGPEVFLKALSISRNQTSHPKKITTANFDIIPLGDYKTDIPDTRFDYYYRPRKNVINRPSSLGGTGLYIMGDHADTVPALWKLINERFEV